MNAPAPPPKDRRLLFALAGAAVAVIAGVGLAKLLFDRRPIDTKPPPASQAGLIIEAGNFDQAKLDPDAKLRCFVGGQFVGEATLADCAQQNGVLTGGLDVGVDGSGALAAADHAGALLTPLPPPEVKAAPGEVPKAQGLVDSCWRYGGGEWRKLQTSMSLTACVQALYAGRCEREGGASYGRWATQTLRLVPGRIEISSDNRSFRTLGEQSSGCALGPLDLER